MDNISNMSKKETGKKKDKDGKEKPNLNCETLMTDEGNEMDLESYLRRCR